MTSFERFFAEDFKRKLDAVKGEPGIFTSASLRIEDASWDRKAAFLLWVALGRPGAANDFEDLL